MHRDTGEWRHGEAISLLPLQKSGNEAEMPFHHTCRSRQMCGVRRIFAEFPQTCPKSFLCNFCHFGVTSRKVFICFFNFGRHFYPHFQGFFPDFQQIKTFRGALAIPAPPSPTPLIFISRFIKIGLKQIYCNYSGTQKIQNNFLKFMLLFLRSSLLMIRNRRIGKNFLFVISFHWPQPFYCFPSLQLLRRPEYPCCVNKIRQNVGLQTWIWRYIVTSQTACIQ